MRSVGIGALGALALALTACGADDPAADGAGDAIVADEAQAEEIVDETEDVDPEELGGDEDDIVLTFWHPSSAVRRGMRAGVVVKPQVSGVRGAVEPALAPDL